MCRWIGWISWIWLCGCSLAWGQIGFDTFHGGHTGIPASMESQRHKLQLLLGKVIVSGQQNMRSLRVDAIFAFQNLSKRDLHLVLLAPVPVYNKSELGGSAPLGYQLRENRPMVHRFRNYVVAPSGNQLVDTPKFHILSRRSLPSIRSSIPGRKLGAYRWVQTFPAGKITKVHISYTTGITSGTWGTMRFDYLLKTARLWFGGRPAMFQLEFRPNTPITLRADAKEAAKRRMELIRKGARFFGRGKNLRIRWHIRDFRRNFSFYFLPKRMYFQGQGRLRMKFSNVPSMNETQLRFARNTIFAKYGYRFKSMKLRRYFLKKWWYVPNPKFHQWMFSAEDRKLLGQILLAEKKFQGRYDHRLAE